MGSYHLFHCLYGFCSRSQEAESQKATPYVDKFSDRPTGHSRQIERYLEPNIVLRRKRGELERVKKRRRGGRRGSHVDWTRIRLVYWKSVTDYQGICVNRLPRESHQVWTAPMVPKQLKFHVTSINCSPSVVEWSKVQIHWSVKAWLDKTTIRYGTSIIIEKLTSAI